MNQACYLLKLIMVPLSCIRKPSRFKLLNSWPNEVSRWIYSLFPRNLFIKKNLLMQKCFGHILELKKVRFYRGKHKYKHSYWLFLLKTFHLHVDRFRLLTRWKMRLLDGFSSEQIQNFDSSFVLVSARPSNRSLSRAGHSDHRWFRLSQFGQMGNEESMACNCLNIQT